MGMKKLLIILLSFNLLVIAQDAKYRRVGPVYLNDLRATPGGVVNVTLQALCTPGYTQTVRDVSASVKKEACQLYGVPPEHCNGRELEIDHLISLK